MDNEKIKELAERYVKEEHYDDFFLSEATRVIQWLFKTHCIVEKKSVAEWVNGIEFFMPDKRSVTMLKIGAKSLFGKELFNNNEK